MSARDLDAAGILDPELRASYEACRALNKRHGKTYYLATLLLPPAKRPFVHALYGFARYADDIVDDLDVSLSASERAARFDAWSSQFLTDIDAGESRDVVTRALIDTVRRWDIPTEHFGAFLRSMRMDLTVCEYRTYAELSEYVYGSAAVIGLQMVPILEPIQPEAAEHAMALGVAFQLANFVRDVNEDLDRGRIYLPLDELAEHGVDRDLLERRVATAQVKAALRSQVERVRDIAASAAKGVTMLHPSSRDCIDAARVLYIGIVDEVQSMDYDVFAARASVPVRRRLAVALPAWRRARRARRLYGAGTVPAAVTVCA